MDFFSSGAINSYFVFVCESYAVVMNMKHCFPGHRNELKLATAP